MFNCGKLIREYTTIDEQLYLNTDQLYKIATYTRRLHRRDQVYHKRTVLNRTGSVDYIPDETRDRAMLALDDNLITARQTEAVELWLYGYTQAEVADIMRISQPAVNGLIGRVKTTMAKQGDGGEKLGT